MNKTYNLHTLEVLHRSKEELGIPSNINLDAVLREPKSKFIGKKYDGWTVIASKVKNDYKKCYGGSVKATSHNALNYLLTNDKGQTIELSGNSLRLVNNGVTSVNRILQSKKKGPVRKLLSL